MVAITRLGIGSIPVFASSIAAKADASLPPFGMLLEAFDTWRPTYGGNSVLALMAGTTQKARLFSDPGLTTEIANPQTLLTMTDENGVTYGRWVQPVYTPYAVFLSINESENTGVTRPPMYTPDGADASRMLVRAERGTRTRVMREVVDDLIFAENFGSLAEANGAEANTAVLNRAIGAAAAQGGGDVLLPAGRIIFTSVTLPVTVRLVGQGEGVTTLTSTFAGVAVTLDGDGAGLKNLTLDGINLVPGSVGVQGTGIISAVLDNVIVKRFERCIRFRGITSATWRNLWVSDAVYGMELRGDTDAAGTGTGGLVRGITWIGGGASLCTTCAICLNFFDALVENITLEGVSITDNIGDSLLISGARNVVIGGATYFETAEGERAVKIQDDTNLALRSINTVDHITFRGGIFNGGTLLFNGTCASVVFVRSDFRSVSFDLTVPSEVIVLDNCIEDADTTATGDTTKLMRSFQSDDRQVSGNTADAVPTVAWSKTLEPGEVGFFQAEVVAQQQDGIKFGFWWVASGAARPGATLDFNLQTANFTAGAVVTGATSGATAGITAVVQSAGSGTLTLRDIEGTFIDGEQITDDDGGDARVDGTISTSNAALDGTGNTDMRTPTTTGTYDAYWECSGAKMRLMVVGDTGEAVQWVARVRELVS